MNVATLDLCKELYAISGWDDTDSYHGDAFSLDGEHFYTLFQRQDGVTPLVSTPAYDLGYLLRKLPAIYDGAETLLVIAKQESGSYWASYFKNAAQSYFADTSEDALCRLAIELIKQNILQPSVTDKESV